MNPSQKLVKIYWPVCEFIKPKASVKWQFDDIIAFLQKVRKRFTTLNPQPGQTNQLAFTALSEKL